MSTRTRLVNAVSLLSALGLLLGLLAVRAGVTHAQPGVSATNSAAGPKTVSPSAQITNDSVDDAWGPRNGVTSQGRILWFSDTLKDVAFYDGATTTVVQSGASHPGLVSDTVFVLGSGPAPGEVMGVWRRGDNDAWIWVSSGGAPFTVANTNPFDPGNAANLVNPEGAAVADGYVFLILQAFDPLSAHLVKLPYRANLADGTVVNLHPGGNDSNAYIPRISTDSGQAAWVNFPIGGGDAVLYFYDGATARAVDSGILGELTGLARGVLAYTKSVGGVFQVFVYNSSSSGATPVPLTSDATGSNRFPVTDGYHVAWMHENDGATRRDIMLNGGLVLTDESSLISDPVAFEFPLQLQRGQMVWKDIGQHLRYEAGGAAAFDGYHTSPVVNLDPAISLNRPCLANGHVAWYGLSGDSGTDTEIFQYTGSTPQDPASLPPPLLLLASPGNRQVTLQWDVVAGATSYNLYASTSPNVVKSTEKLLPGTVKVSGVSSPYVFTDLSNNKTFYFTVTAVDGNAESATSGIAQATPCAGTWDAVGNLDATSIQAVAADPAAPLVIYAAGGLKTYQSTNGGTTWTPLAGNIDGQDVRALAVHGADAFAATKDDVLLRSLDGGGTWSSVASSTAAVGEQRKSLSIDPSTPTTVYAGDFHLSTITVPDDALLIASTDGGGNWHHLLQPNPATDDLRGYAIAVSGTGTVFVGGSGTPALARSTNGGTSWTDLGFPIPNIIYSLALHPTGAGIVYAGTLGNGIYVTVDGGTTWTQKNQGLPLALPGINALVVDPLLPSRIYAGTDSGLYYSPDSGDHWVARMDGFAPAAASVNALVLLPGQCLIAGTNAGIYRLDLTVANTPPVLAQSTNQNSAEGQSVELQLSALDSDMDVLTFGVSGLPPGLSMDTSTGLISGVLDYAAAGSHLVSVSVSDGAATDQKSFTWLVSNTNRPPSLSNPGGRSDPEGTSIVLQLAASDPDGDSLSYGATGLPPGLSLHPVTGIISGVLPYTAAGTYPVAVSAGDGTDTIQVAFTWTVVNVSGPPVVNVPSDQSSLEGTTVSLQLSASDPEGDVLTYGATGLPPGLSIAPATGLISGELGFISAGSYSVMVTVSDGAHSVEASFAWTVIDVSSAPGILSPGDQVGIEGDAVSLGISASDAESDVLTFSATGLPPGLMINAATGLIQGVIPAGAVGSYFVTVSVTDGTRVSHVSFGWSVLAGAAGVAGDVDGNGDVNAVDVQLVINAALGVSIAPYSGDVNHNGVVDAVDVQLVINAALGI